MKKIILFTLITPLLIFTFVTSSVGQSEFILHVDVETCFSDGNCEIISRQYTGITTRYTIAIRCMEPNGDFGDWYNWEYEGINNGSYCN